MARGKGMVEVGTRKIFLTIIAIAIVILFFLALTIIGGIPFLFDNILGRWLIILWVILLAIGIREALKRK